MATSFAGCLEENIMDTSGAVPILRRPGGRVGGVPGAFARL